jgi:hypothetical protein
LRSRRVGTRRVLRLTAAVAGGLPDKGTYPPLWGGRTDVLQAFAYPPLWGGPMSCGRLLTGTR